MIRHWIPYIALSLLAHALVIGGVMLYLSIATLGR
jgi:hypothetical protein